MRPNSLFVFLALLLSSCASSEPPPSSSSGGKAAAVSATNFDQEVLASKIPVLVDFWAPWCGPCVAIGPHVDDLAGDLVGKVKVVKVNIDEAQAIADKYNVRAIPTFILFKNGEVVRRSEGAPGTNKSALAAWVKAGLN